MEKRWGAIRISGKICQGYSEEVPHGGKKPMETPLAGNWRKEDANSGEVVDAIVYR